MSPDKLTIKDTSNFTKLENTIFYTYTYTRTYIIRLTVRCLLPNRKKSSFRERSTSFDHKTNLSGVRFLSMTFMKSIEIETGCEL